MTIQGSSHSLTENTFADYTHRTQQSWFKVSEQQSFYAQGLHKGLAQIRLCHREFSGRSQARLPLLTRRVAIPLCTIHHHPLLLRHHPPTASHLPGDSIYPPSTAYYLLHPRLHTDRNRGGWISAVTRASFAWYKRFASSGRPIRQRSGSTNCSLYSST